MRIGILTAGGDCPGLNAAIRGVGKTAILEYGMEVVGFSSGYLGLINENYTFLTDKDLSGILTLGGTILATQFGSYAKELVNQQKFGRMVALQDNRIKTVPLEEVAGKLKLVPPDHRLIRYAKSIDTNFGDKI